jgi:tRNA pseudouridine38-40 synthase
MERYQVILTYDGTDFHGSQYQTDTRTVQDVFETALRKLKWTGKAAVFSGRTDAGVHASGQVAAFDLAWKHSSEDLRNAMNALLPKDVAVISVVPSTKEFHPRFDAVSRRYLYRIYSQPVRDPTRERFYWRVWPTPDLELMQLGANLFLGVHDFAAFGRPTSPSGRTVRNVLKAYWLNVGDEFTFEIVANAFLYHMVRRMVFVLTKFGQGKLFTDELEHHINRPQMEPIQGLAPPQGLSLVEVTYPKGEKENNDKIR